MDFLNRLQPFALLVMRLVLGAIMIAHGYHKVWGGFHHHMDFVGSLGLPKWLAYFSAGTEFFGGIAIVLGLFTRFFAAATFSSPDGPTRIKPRPSRPSFS